MPPLLFNVPSYVERLTEPMINPSGSGLRQTSFSNNGPGDGMTWASATTPEQILEVQQNTSSAPSTPPPATLPGSSLIDIGLDGLAKTKTPEDGDGIGALAPFLEPAGNGLVNIVNDYQWTITPTKNRNDVPYIELTEYRVEGGAIGKQVNFYINGITGAVGDYFSSEGSKNSLDVYDAIFLRNTPSNWKYRFPYFTKSQYELATAAWEKFDKIGQSASGVASGLAGMFKSLKMDITGGVIDIAAKLTGAVAAAGETALKGEYPLVNVSDRPRVFTSHSERSVTITFPLLNTINVDDWYKNKQFLTLFQYQNLFNKRNFITGLPPVWYTVYVPSQYYSAASCVTNIRVENLGNIRLENAKGKEFIVPDAYQVEITLQEMAMPSQNQFMAAILNSPQGPSKVTVNASPQNESPSPGTPKTPTNTATAITANRLR